MPRRKATAIVNTAILNRTGAAPVEAFSYTAHTAGEPLYPMPAIEYARRTVTARNIIPEAKLLLLAVALSGKESLTEAELSAACGISGGDVDVAARQLAALGLARWRDGSLSLPRQEEVRAS